MLVFTVIAGLVALGSPDPVRTPPHVAFEWVAPDGCPHSAAVERRIEQQVDAPLQDLQVRQLTIAAHVEPIDDGFRVELTTTTAAGTRARVLDSPGDCDAAADLTALVVAVALDEFVAAAAAAEPEPEPQPQPEPEATVAPVPDDPVPPKPIPAKQPRFQGALRVEGLGSAGDLPGFGGELGASLALLLPKARVFVDGRYGFPRRRDVEGTVEAGAELSLWTVGAGACPVPKVARVEFPICAAFEVGQLIGEPVGLSTSRQGRATWAAFRVAPQVLYVPVRWVGLGGGVEGFVPLTRPRFEVGREGGEVEEVFSPAPVGVRVFLAVEARFP